VIEETKEEPLHYPGTHPKRPLVMEEGPCLFEYALTKELLNQQPIRMAHVDTLYGVVKRLMVKVWVFIKSKPTQVYADVVTGTVFLESGECLSSIQRRVVKWGNYQRLEKKQKVNGRTVLQDRWNKGL
jgi:hypothetical protein